MGNVVDYVRREFRGFGELAFSNVDSLVLSELSYMRLPGLVPAFGEAKSVATVPIRDLLRAESYDEMFVSNCCVRFANRRDSAGCGWGSMPNVWMRASSSNSLR